MPTDHKAVSSVPPLGLSPPIHQPCPAPRAREILRKSSFHAAEKFTVCYITPSGSLYVTMCNDNVRVLTPDNSHDRHDRRWCTFFKPAYLFPQRTRNGLLLGKFIQRIKTFFVMKIDAPSQILNVTNTTSQCHRHQLRQKIYNVRQTNHQTPSTPTKTPGTPNKTPSTPNKTPSTLN